MRWFGPAYGAPYESDMPHVPTPVGQDCDRCGEPILWGEGGLLVPHVSIDPPVTRERPLHYECHLRTVIGGLNHLRGQCQCCGGTLPPDPPELTRRQAALEAMWYWNEHR